MVKIQNSLLYCMMDKKGLGHLTGRHLLREKSSQDTSVKYFSVRLKAKAPPCRFLVKEKSTDIVRKTSRNYIRDYPCSYQPARYINSEDVFEETDLNFPVVYKTAEGMAQVAREIGRANQADIFGLPFCYTVELEAYGGRVNYGDEKVGPRPGAYVLDEPKDLLKLKEPNVNEGRMGEVLKAVRILKKEGRFVSVSTAGAFLIMSGMMDLVPLLKAVRKEEPFIIEAFENFRKFEIKYYMALAEAGADIISMSELSMANIFGPEISEKIVKYYLYPFFKEAEEKVDASLHICPKSTYALVDTGYARFEEARLNRTCSYGMAMIEARDEKHKIFGRRCIGNRKIDVSPGGLRWIVLK